MNSQKYRNLSEAYLDVYQELDEATAMAKRGLDEPAIRNKIASQTRSGEFADKATALADKETYGNTEMKAGREKLARNQRGDFRNTTSSSPGLRGYGHQSSDPAVKAKQSARGAQRGVLTPNEKKQLNREAYDLFDYIMEYLITEGYADTNENALVIMANMSEDWKQSIVEAVDPEYSGPSQDPLSRLDRTIRRGVDFATGQQAAEVRAKQKGVPGNTIVTQSGPFSTKMIPSKGSFISDTEMRRRGQSTTPMGRPGL